MSNHKLKISLLGAAAVGKTSLIQRFVNNKYGKGYKLTVGVDILTKDIEYKTGEFATLSIWDTGGQQRFEFIRSTFYKGSSGGILVFDLSRRGTYTETRKWLEEFRQFAGGNIPFVLVGNKKDLEEYVGEIVAINEARQFAESEDSIYIEASAEIGKNVDRIFKELTLRIIEKRASTKPSEVPIKTEKIQNLQEIFNEYINNSTKFYNSLKNELNIFNRIENYEQYQIIDSMFEDLDKLDINSPDHFTVKLILLKLLYDYYECENDNVLMSEISEIIAKQCYNLLSNIDNNQNTLNSIDFGTICEFYNDYEIKEKHSSKEEMVKEIFSTFLLITYLYFLQNNYKRLIAFFEEEGDIGETSQYEIDMFFIFSGINVFYYQLIKNSVNIVENEDIIYWEEIYEKYLENKINFSNKVQSIIEDNFKYLKEFLPIIKISKFKKEEPIKLGDYVILEFEIKNNTMNRQVKFNMKIEPNGFTNYSHLNPWLKNYNLKPGESIPVFIDFGEVKTVGKCPICFYLSYRNKRIFDSPVRYIEVNEKPKSPKVEFV